MEESESAESDEMPSPPKMSMKPLNINIPHHGERERYVNTLWEKHNNDLLDRLSSDGSRDEVIYF